MAARVMLKRRGVGSVSILTRRGSGKAALRPCLAGHCGVAVTGYSVTTGFAEIGYFV
jgi:hypothetical protein